MDLAKNTFTGTRSKQPGLREEEHRKLARRAAAEGIVLLENNGILPLRAGSSVAVYGGGALYTIKGGTGSGSVNNRSNVSIAEGLENAGFEITTKDWLSSYRASYEAAYKVWEETIYEKSVPGDFDSLYNVYSVNRLKLPQGDPYTKTFSSDGTCPPALYVISRVSGESADRRNRKGDYCLSDEEMSDLRRLSGLYPELIVVLNVGGVIDLSFTDDIPVSALVLLSQAGMEGGNALADVLTGAVPPCGHLTDTWAYRYEDYPSAATFGHMNGNLVQEYYNEGIYVGYRYFDSFEVKPRYPFGYGLSYTTFKLCPESTELISGAAATVRVRVVNTGAYPGREVVQLYAACPFNEKRGTEDKRLVSFAKTSLLAPGGSEVLSFTFALSDLKSYHTGRSEYYMDAGTYVLLAGENSDATVPAACLTLSERVVLEKLTPVCPLLDSLKEFFPDPEKASLRRKKLLQTCSEAEVPVLSIDDRVPAMINSPGSLPSAPGKAVLSSGVSPVKVGKTSDSAAADDPVVRLLARMTRLEKAQLVCGQPSSGSKEVIGSAAVHVPGGAGETTNALTRLGLGSMVLADGPAGLRLQQHYQVSRETGKLYVMSRYESLQNRFFATEFLHDDADDYYQYCSAIPVGTLLAQSFDPALLEEVGMLIGREMKEFGVTLWLAPGMNIHRNPLCGRNFEYYSEDPMLSGTMAAAVTRGVQSLGGIGVTIKHFACNNQEDNRMNVSAVVSERALREIYLRGFEIAVKTSAPAAVMTSYNRINSVHSANSYDLCTKVLRQEWGFDGIVMTDWLTTNNGHGSSAAKCIAAGNDLVMPGHESDIREILDALTGEGDLFLDEADLDSCVLRILKYLL